MDLRPGNVVFGDSEAETYEIIEMIGSGGFGAVYKVKAQNGDIFALKTILTANLSDEGLQALINEGQLSTEVQHENVVRVFYFHDGKQYPQFPPYMVMEYADGGTLSNLLSEKREQGEFFDPPQLQKIFTELALGMRAINNKLVHRDIKPDNILLVNGKLKIADFGLSKIVGAATRTQTLKGINHIMYCAPEAWRLDKNLPSMDMYSMGITFYEIATLRHPYNIEASGNIVEAWKSAHFTKLPEEPRQYNSALAPRLSQLILKMMAKRSEERYKSWDEVLERLENSENNELKNRNVSSLVELAFTKHLETERQRLEGEARINKEREQEELISYSFLQILDAAKETVEAFNKQSEFLKLEIHEASKMGFSIYANKGAGALPTVSAKVEPADNVKLRDNQIVIAWGWAKAPSGRGFNLLLITSGDEDFYGHWQTLHVSHNPIMAVTDRRPEPFFFKLNELPKEVHNLNALHIYQTQKSAFQPDFFDALIAELI